MMDVSSKPFLYARKRTSPLNDGDMQAKENSSGDAGPSKKVDSFDNRGNSKDVLVGGGLL